MDLTAYATMKAAGQATLEKLNDAYVLSVTGLNPETAALDSNTIQAQLAILKSKIESLSLLLADLEALG